MRSLIHFSLAALMGVALWASPAVGQESARVRAQGTLPAPVFEQIDAAAQRAEARGIPGDILFRKALEGAAKRVPEARLAPAVEAYAGRLFQAREAFGGNADGPLLVAGADALQRGVGQDLLRGLGQSQDRSPMACLVLAELVETGLGGEHALSLVQEALMRRAREQQMLDMPGEVRRLMRQGQSAQEVMEQMRQGLRRGGGVMTPVAPGSEPMARGRRGGG